MGPQLETVRSISVCRVLVVPRAAYEQVAAAFPIGARTVLTNLLSRAQEVRGSPHSPNCSSLKTSSQMRSYTYRGHAPLS